jgi:hypothetical protein
MSRSALRRGLIPAIVALACPLAAGAQEIQGVALGPAGEPLPGVVVALHRVGDMGAGANVASVTTDAEGRFRFEIAAPDSALYFAAMRYDGLMYIGPPAMGGAQRITDYPLVADPAAEAGAVASALSGEPMGVVQGPPARDPRAAPAGGQGGGEGALWIVGILALTAAALFMTTAPRYRRRRTRDLLIEVATLENRLAEGPPSDERRELMRRRDQIRDRLAPRG